MSQIKKFFINDTSVIVNLTTKNCMTKADILDSVGFKKVISNFFLQIGDNSNRKLQKIKLLTKKPNIIIDFLKMLLAFKFEEAVSNDYKFYKLAKCRNEMVVFIEMLYSYWLRLERYEIIQRRLVEMNIDNSIMIESIDDFSKQVSSLYRFLLSKLLDTTIRINRQTSVGFNAGFIVTPEIYQFPKDYSLFKGVNIISGVVMKTPFMGYSNDGKNDLTLKEIDHNPLNFLRMTKRHWFCFPIKVGGILAFVFFHRTLMHLGMALCNTFEPGINDYYKGKKPKLVCVYGGLKQEEDNTFFIDKENDFYLSYSARNKENDCFKNMRNMILNLHNVYMVKHNNLPLKGTMVNIVTKTNKETNILITGDNGELNLNVFNALNYIPGNNIVELNVIFSDMGMLYSKENSIFARGTGIGLCMKQNYLEYSVHNKDINRSIILNPESSVPKLILKNTSYEYVLKENKIDYIFCVNKSTNTEDRIDFLETKEQVLSVFKNGVNEDGKPLRGISCFTGGFKSERLIRESNKLVDKVLLDMISNNHKFGKIHLKMKDGRSEQIAMKSIAKKIANLL